MKTKSTVIPESQRTTRRMKLSQKSKMRDLFEKGYAVSYIARKFECKPNAVWNTVYDLAECRKLSKEEEKYALRFSKVTKKQVLKIRRDAHKHGCKSWEISETYGISQTGALCIIKGKTFRWLGGWVRPSAYGPWKFLVPIPSKKEIRRTDLRRGPKKGSKPKVKSGTLLEIAKKRGISTSSVCRLIKSGKIKVPKRALVSQ